MNSSFFFLQATKSHLNQNFVDSVAEFAALRKEQTYLLSSPLGDSRYSYEHTGAMVVLSPKRKLTFVDFNGDADSFAEFVDDFVEDLASISDKYRYKESIGRPRSWKSDLVAVVQADEPDPFERWRELSALTDPGKQRVAELLVSLLTGSINDIERVQADLPKSLLEKVKRKIQLFDGDQTRFIYEKPKKNVIRIQGLSGTGKTELLLHKLRDLYVNEPKSKIVFTCHNKILAEHLRRRIPNFFNFMKVEEQIAWHSRLWCFHGWGSNNNPNTGTYRLICDIYKLQFQPYSAFMSFDRACTEALAQLGDRVVPHFDYMLIDESQDFPESFIQLCKKVSKGTLYVAGDIFQSIFDANITPSIAPDHLLSKCYRTDPRTLMFAHAIGMGLFEQTKLRWLEDQEWEACGYIVKKAASDSLYRLTREPLRRFEDIDNSLPSVVIEQVTGEFREAAASSIVAAIRALAQEHPTLQPDDVGIIILDRNNDAFSLADKLAVMIRRELGWQVNKAHESKRTEPGQLFVSNKNNVKGLEFPFVICVSENITNGYVYRNSLYMTLTRSFLQSHMIVSSKNADVLPRIQEGLQQVNREGQIEVMPPDEREKAEIRTTIAIAASSLSFFDMAEKAFDEVGVIQLMREQMLTALKSVIGEESDYQNVLETSRFMYDRMMRNRV